MENITGFAIIGSGNIARTYIKAIHNVDTAEVVGVVSRPGRKPAGFEGIPAFTALHEIEQPYDAVIICTPNGLHHLGAIEAAELGKHVLCEKPIDITIEAIDKMIDACRENNVKLGVAYQRRFSSDNPVVKKMIAGGQLGRIFSVDLAIRNYRDDAYYNSADYRGTYAIDGGGPFIQQASHYIDLYQWYFGRPIRIISMLDTFLHDIEVEDHGAVLCKHPSGLIGTITASTATKPGFPARLEIYSDKGWLRMENDLITEWDIAGIDNPSRSAVVNQHTGSSSPLVDDTQNHEYVIQDFIQSIKTGREPLVTGASAKTTTEIILEIYNSNARTNWVLEKILGK